MAAPARPVQGGGLYARTGAPEPPKTLPVPDGLETERERKLMRKIGASLIAALWLPLAGAAVAIVRFGELPLGGVGAEGPAFDLLLLYVAGLPAALCAALAWPPPRERRAQMRFPMAVVTAVMLGALLTAVGAAFGPLWVLAGGLAAALPLLGPARDRLRRG